METGVLEPTCSKCGGNLDRKTNGSARWCKACRAKYQLEYEATRKEMSGTQQFAAGVSAMREYLARNFRQYGSAGFSGHEIAETIMKVKGPASA